MNTHPALILLCVVWFVCGAVAFKTKDPDCLSYAFALTFLIGLGYFLLHKV